MRDQDKDLELPSLGPAERELNTKRPGGGAQSEPLQDSAISRPQNAAKQPRRSGGNGLSFLIILLLAAAVAGLAYWSFMQHQQLQALKAERKTVDEKIAELQKLFLVAGNSAAESGESLQNQVQREAAAVQQQFDKVDARIAKLTAENGKLWVIAHERNTPKIAELEKRLSGVSAQIDKQTKSLEGMTGELATLDKQLKSVDAKSSEASKQLAGIRQSAAALSTEFQALSESVELQGADQKKNMASLTRQITSLKEGQGQGAGLERRVKVNEQAVKAIDGSRLVMNNQLLQIRQQLNNLQLKLEQMQ